MRPESRKDQRAAFTAALRADGWTWEEIADEFRRQERCSPLAGLRLARGMSQQDVADAYNTFLTPDPDDKPIDFRRVSRWEQWPHGGATPTLEALNRLARIYHVSAAFLFEGEDHRHLDSAYRPDPDSPLLADAIARSTTSPDQRQGAAPSPGGGNALVIHPGQLAEFRPGPPGQRAGGQAQSRHLFVLHGRNPMERRAVLAAIASLPGVSLLPGQPGNLLDPASYEILDRAVRRPRSVGAEALAPLDKLIMGVRQLDDTLGSRIVAEPVAGILQLISDILPSAVPSVRQPLFSRAASAAQLAGWLAVDSGNHEKARELYDQALEWATAADDTAMMAYLWVCRSEKAWDAQDAISAVRTAEAARRIATGLDKTLRAWVERNAGRVYALAGDLDETVRAMDNANALLADADPETSPQWLYYFNNESLLAGHGLALTGLGQGRKAAKMLGEALDGLSAAFCRDRGTFLAYQADAFRVSGEIEQACTIGMQALDIAHQTASGRTIERVGRIHDQLNRQTPELSDVRDLGQALRENNGST